MGSFFNLFQTMPQATTRRYFGKHHFHLPLDDSKKVIEVVSDAARQLPNRLHFLSLPQLVLHLFPFRDVFREDFEIRNFTGAIGYTPPAKTNQDGLSATATPRAFESLTGTSATELYEKFIVADRLVEDFGS